jgi:hypothetical protein
MLKTNNYVSKSTGITLPTAYAVLGDLVINRKTNNARAVFLVQANRENAMTLKPLDEVKVEFVWDRKTDPAKMAYETAKAETREIEKYNEKGEPYTEVEYGTLYGWQDDIV